VVFHSGQPFDAAAAEWSVKHVQDPKSGAPATAELQSVKTQIVDATTLQVTFAKPMPHIFSLLAEMAMIDPQSDLTRAVGGTGAFKIVNFIANDQLELARHDHYWRSGRPHLNQLTIKSLPDPATARLNLESGAAQVVQVAPSDVADLQKNSQTGVELYPAAGNYDWMMNAADPPFSDKRVRRAIDLAIDRKRYAQTFLYGLTDPTVCIFTKRSPVWDATIDSPEFNLDKARQLLADAGYQNGFETKIQGSSGGYPDLTPFNEIAQADLAKIGIKADLEDLDFNQQQTIVNQAKFPAIINHIYSYADSDPAMVFTGFALRPEGNPTRFESAEYVQMVNAGEAESNWDKRVAIYRQIAQFVRDQAFILPLADRMIPWGRRSNVLGLTKQSTQPYPLFDEVWMS
jgi:peptide/nickel transport system substrate-binding protein